MVEARMNFPRGFLWGTATSSHQVEGNNKSNNWYAWEEEAGRIIHGHKAGLACDWWGGRWKEDFDRAAESRQNAHRLSIEWSRVQPTPDRWNEDAIDHYRQIIRGLGERKMFPIVTLHHFTDPLWLTEMGGWENEEVGERFSVYVSKMVEALKSYVTTWCTINEPNVVATMGYLFGVFPPGVTDIQRTMAVMTNQVRAHAMAYRKIKEIQPESRVGMALNWRGFKAARNWAITDRIAANLFNTFYNDFFPRMCMEGAARLLTKKVSMPEAKGTQDYVGLNYYSGDLVRFDLQARDEMFVRRFYPEGMDLSYGGYIANRPDEFFRCIEWGLQFKVPLIVTENGTEDSEDSHRRRYIVQHIHKLWHAVNFNYPIKGYFHWSQVDNFEWERGWTQRFGLWELDEKTQARRKRRSADLYGAICRENALSSRMVREYAPEIFEKLFPG
ncbi:MAG: family 1 glycosylhydrolase [Anaerolineales bacterium]|jgi:beta-glucosidase